MNFSFKPDYEKSKERYDAFWERQVTDHPPIAIQIPKADGPSPIKPGSWKNQKDRWLDFDYRVAEAVNRMERTLFLIDALPTVFPNLGPEIFSAWCGCPYFFGETTTWSEPVIIDWEKDAQNARFDPEHYLFKALLLFTDKLMQAAKGKFIVGMTDLHPGGDHLAALRDPQNLAVDLIQNPEQVRNFLPLAEEDFFKVYNLLYEKLHAAGMPITSWTPLISEGKYYIPSNDFSIMISTDMFESYFLDQLTRECAFYDQSIYHLDGVGAFRHLDLLLSIEDLDAVQLVPGAGNEGFSKYVEYYQRIQQAGKSMQILDLTLKDLPLLFDSLKPNGVYVSGIAGIENIETALEVEKAFIRWTKDCS